PFLIVEGARRGLQITPWFAPFGQLEVPVLDTNGPLYSGKPAAIVIFARLEELAPALFEHFSAEAAVLETVAGRLRDLLRNLRERTSAVVFVANFAPAEHL